MEEIIEEQSRAITPEVGSSDVATDPPNQASMIIYKRDNNGY